MARVCLNPSSYLVPSDGPHEGRVVFLVRAEVTQPRTGGEDDVVEERRGGGDVDGDGGAPGAEDADDGIGLVVGEFWGEGEGREATLREKALESMRAGGEGGKRKEAADAGTTGTDAKGGETAAGEGGGDDKTE